MDETIKPQNKLLTMKNDKQFLQSLLSCGSNKLPLCGHYAMLIDSVSAIFGRDSARRNFGLFTYKQWDDLLKKHGITI